MDHFFLNNVDSYSTGSTTSSAISTSTELWIVYYNAGPSLLLEKVNLNQI